MIVELTLAQAATSMAGAVAYAASKCKSGEDSEAIIPPASIFKRLHKGDKERIYIRYFGSTNRLYWIVCFELQDGFFTKRNAWKEHWGAHLLSIEGCKEWGWLDHPTQHSDVSLPLPELLDFMSSNKF